MARAPEVWRIACPRCAIGRVLAGDGGGGSPGFDVPFAVHDCFTCELSTDDIARAIAANGLPGAREPSDWGVPLARAHYAEELERCVRAFGPRHLSVARCHVALARSHDTLGGSPEQHYAAAWAMRDAAGAPDHPVWLELAAGFGYALKNRGHAGQARPCYDMLRLAYERVLGAAHLVVADCYRLLGDLSLAARDPETARACFEHEIALWAAAPDDAVAAYRDRARDLPPAIARTTYALHPLHRDGDGDYRAHQRTVAGARLAIALDRLGSDDVVGRSFGELDVDAALHVGDRLCAVDKAFSAARAFYAHAAARIADDDPRVHTIRAKLQMAETMAEAEREVDALNAR
jgi:hypothetical protein